MKNCGLFLDFDGTLVDSIDSLKTVYFKFLETVECQGSDEEFNRFNGPPLDQIVRALKKDHELQQSEETLIQLYTQTMQGVYDKVRSHSGATELLKAAQANGWPCAVVTSNSKKVVRNWLDKHDLGSYISGIIGMENVTVGKPSAEPYLKALMLLNCDPKESFAIEDSVLGFTSARAAGIPTFLLRKELKLERYNMTIHSLADVIPYLGKMEKAAC